jgi:phage terminase Nu1 subunit (DNA packaging protein)
VQVVSVLSASAAGAIAAPQAMAASRTSTHERRNARSKLDRMSTEVPLWLLSIIAAPIMSVLQFRGHRIWIAWRRTRR